MPPRSAPPSPVVASYRPPPAIPCITSTTQAQELARAIAGWKPLPVPLRQTATP